MCVRPPRCAYLIEQTDAQLPPIYMHALLFMDAHV